MNHLPHLIFDLGLILVAAGITTLLFKALKQPVVLGYILAGLLVSPKFSLLPSVLDVDSIQVWADIGVIFLLFSLGLEFSFKKLLKIGGPASLTAFIEISFMFGLGFATGALFGWSFINCLFLGGILCISSTTIIMRAFDELGVKNSRFAQLVFGVLIVEDLVAVVLLVLLSTIAVSNSFQGGEMIQSILKLIFFLVLWFVSGILFIPTFLKKAAKWLNEETLLIVALGLCLSMVILASLAGFSPALGAFVMGSILAETIYAERIEHIMKPIKDLFGAVFFISVGMLIDVHVLSQYALPIIIFSLIVIIGKTIGVSAGALISGQTLRRSIRAGMSLTQIGEFSFIIATLGLSLKVTSSFLYPIAVAVSALTTFTTPYLIKVSLPFHQYVEDRLPPKWRKSLMHYSAGTQSITAASDWNKLLRGLAVFVFLSSIIIIEVILVASQYLPYFIFKYIDNSLAGTIVNALITFVIISPFLWGLAVRKIQEDAVANLWAVKRYRSPLKMLNAVRVILTIVYIGFFLQTFFSWSVALVSLLVLLTTSVLFYRKIHRVYLYIDRRFFANFHDRETHEAISNRLELAPWDARIIQVEMPETILFAGQTLGELQLREQHGINVAMIRRGKNYTIHAPKKNERIYPGDILFIIGSEEQIDNFRKYVQPASPTQRIVPVDKVVLKKLFVNDRSALNGSTISASGIREKTNGIVVGLERDGKRILNPESATTFILGDKIWIVGEEAKIKTIPQ